MIINLGEFVGNAAAHVAARRRATVGADHDAVFEFARDQCCLK